MKKLILMIAIPLSLFSCKKKETYLGYCDVYKMAASYNPYGPLAGFEYFENVTDEDARNRFNSFETSYRAKYKDTVAFMRSTGMCPNAEIGCSLEHKDE